MSAQFRENLTNSDFTVTSDNKYWLYGSDYGLERTARPEKPNALASSASQTTLGRSKLNNRDIRDAHSRVLGLFDQPGSERRYCFCPDCMPTLPSA
jgi:hypothetical protein